MATNTLASILDLILLMSCIDSKIAFETWVWNMNIFEIQLQPEVFALNKTFVTYHPFFPYPFAFSPV